MRTIKEKRIIEAVKKWREAIDGREAGSVSEVEERAAFAEALLSTLSVRNKAAVLDALIPLFTTEMKAGLSDLLRAMFAPRMRLGAGPVNGGKADREVLRNQLEALERSREQ